MLAHPSAISSLSLSPDGRELVSAGHDASLRFWSLEKRSCTQEITSHRLMRGEGVCSVVWSRDGRWVISGGGDGVVKVFSRWLMNPWLSPVNHSSRRGFTFTNTFFWRFVSPVLLFLSYCRVQQSSGLMFPTIPERKQTGLQKASSWKKSLWPAVDGLLLTVLHIFGSIFKGVSHLILVVGHCLVPSPLLLFHFCTLFWFSLFPTYSFSIIPISLLVLWLWIYHTIPGRFACILRFIEPKPLK